MTLVRFSGSLFLSRSRFYNILRLVRLLPMESCRKGRRRGISSVLPFSKIRRNLQRQLRGSYVIIPHCGCTNASPKMLHRCFAAQMHRKALNSNLTSPLRCPPATLAMAAEVVAALVDREVHRARHAAVTEREGRRSSHGHDTAFHGGDKRLGPTVLAVRGLAALFSN